MFRTVISLIAVAVALAVVRPAVADPPASQQVNEEGAVLDVFRWYNNAMMRLDEEGMDRNNHITTGRERKYANATLETDLAVAKLKLAAKEKFGDTAAPAVGRALGDIGNEDLEGAEVKIIGDRAQVRPKGAAGVRVLVKVGENWKFDLAITNATDEQVDAVIERLRQNNIKTAAMTEDVVAGKYKTLDELLEVISKS